MSPKSYYKNMNMAKAEEIRNLYFKERLNQSEIAIRAGLSQGSVSRIVSNRVWVAV